MTDASAPEMEWDELAPGGEISATVMMMSGFVLPDGQRVRERYEVQGVIGEGAMGQVLAVKLVGSADQQTYALKVVARPVDANDDGVIDDEEHAEALRAAKWFAELLRAEAAKQDQVQRHGVSVARLFALVQLDDDSIGLRMELARGRSLEGWLEDRKDDSAKPPELMWSVQVVRKLVSQLRRLHEMADTGSPFGFVHSDIKPGNVFVDDKDASDITITLLDFGVATAGHALAQDMSMRGGGRKTFILQQTGGTIGYAPPLHFSSKATPLSDVYASLVILYELITFQFPWNFGEMAITGDNIVMLETAMLRGPRPVRDVRPSIHHEDARALDEFFSREFAFLNELAERVHKAFANDDDPIAQQKLTDKLSGLAREYQIKLDQIRGRLNPSRRPNAADLLPVSPDDLEEKPTPLAIPKAPRAPRFGGFDGVDAQDDLSGRPSPAPGEKKPGKPVLMVMPSLPPPPLEAPRAARPDSLPTPLPRGANKLPWILAGIGVPVVAIATVLLLEIESRRDRPIAHGRARRDRGHSDARSCTDHDARPRNRDPRRCRPTAPATPHSHHASVTLAEVRSAPEVTFAPTVNAQANAPAPPGAQSCSCVSSLRGTRVIARGGTLSRDVVLCVTDQPAADGRAEFYGSGSIPVEVFTALPQIGCDATDPLEVTVQRYSTAAGAASLFRCRRATPTAPAQDSPAAADTAADAAVAAVPPNTTPGANADAN